MKRNFIQLVAVMLLLAAKVAKAQESTIEMQAEAQVQQAMRLARINILIRELAKANAVEIDENGKISVKQSIREQLLEKNLLKIKNSARGSLCD